MSKNGFLKNLFNKNSEDEESLSQSIKVVENTISPYDKKMILNIIDMSKTMTKEIMIPRVDVVHIDKDSSLDEIIQVVETKGRSRLPVFDENIDNIIGILHSKELLKYIGGKKDFDIKRNLRQPFFVPETKNINDLLLEMREQKIHLAIVVDEFGGMSGIVCLEDIIERIVGKIEDEFDSETVNIVMVDDKRYLVEGKTSIEELNEALKTNFDTNEVDTLGGLLYILFGKIPSKGEKIEYQNCLFTIETISGRKIKKVLIEILNYKEVDEQ